MLWGADSRGLCAEDRKQPRGCVVASWPVNAPPDCDKLLRVAESRGFWAEDCKRSSDCVADGWLDNAPFECDKLLRGTGRREVFVDSCDRFGGCVAATWPDNAPPDCDKLLRGAVMRDFCDEAFIWSRGREVTAWQDSIPTGWDKLSSLARALRDNSLDTLTYDPITADLESCESLINTAAFLPVMPALWLLQDSSVLYVLCLFLLTWISFISVSVLQETEPYLVRAIHQNCTRQHGNRKREKATN